MNSLRFDKSRFTEFPLNRYEALVETQRLFELNDVSLDRVFEILLDSAEGYLKFSFGDVNIKLVRDSEPPANSIYLSIEFENDGLNMEVSFEIDSASLGLVRSKECAKKQHT